MIKLNITLLCVHIIDRYDVKLRGNGNWLALLGIRRIGVCPGGVYWILPLTAKLD